MEKDRLLALEKERAKEEEKKRFVMLTNNANLKSIYTVVILISGFVPILENLKNPGILFCNFPRFESPGKRFQVLESPEIA